MDSYLLISENSSWELTKRVNEKLNDGWRLYGEPAISSAYAEHMEGIYTYFCQALIRNY